MNAYFDTSALIRMYVVEDYTADIASYILERGLPVAIHGLHELELENGLRAKVFRGEMTNALCREVIGRIAKDISDGLLVRPSVMWYDVFQIARRLSSEITVRSGCRSLDILHVAAAMHWRCSLFISFDDRQIKAADLAHLKALDLRK